MSEPTEYSRPVGDPQGFADAGLLWALNARVLHPEGVEARVVDGEFRLFGFMAAAIHYAPDLVDPVEERRIAYTQTLLDCKQFNNPRHYEGHSPGFNGQTQGSEV